jgi:transmembrane sensor
MKAMERPVSEQAASWLATLSDEACTQEERTQFAAWLLRANTHVEEFLRVSALARTLQGAVAWPQVDLEGLIAEARSQASVVDLHPSGGREDGARTRSVPGPSGRGRWLAAAAVAVLAIAGVFAWKGAGWAGHTYETRLGELRSVTLADGSIVELNALSRIRERYSAAERHIDLVQGEAVFRVAPNRERPFKVSTPFADIVAVGTQFNVDSRENSTVVTVLEGRVRVLPQSAGGAEPPVLGIGEQVVIQREQVAKRLSKVDPARVTGWTARRLHFEDTPLSEAAAEFERYSEKRIRIEDEALAQRLITGTFDAADPGALVRFLARYGDTTVEESQLGWTLVQTREAAERP